MRKFARIKTKMISCILLLAMGALFLASANHVQADQEYLSFDQYKAEHYINYSSYEYFMSDDFKMPYRTTVEKDRSSATFNSLLAAWEVATFSGSNVVEMANKRKGYYEAFLFDIIYTGTDAVNVTDAMNAGIKATQASVLSKVTKLMDEGYYKDIDVRKLTEESYAKLVSGLESCGEFNDIFSAVNNVGKYVQYANDIETLVYRMAKIEAICGQSKEYAEVLRDMSKNTTDETLAAACDEMASICEGVMSAKLMDAIMTGEEVVTNVSKWVTDKIWDYVIDSLGACGIGVTAGQAVGKWASGLLFSTDKTIETYYEMSALYNFDNAIRKVVKKYERQYSRYSSDSVEYAKKFNASVELMLKTQELGCDISIKDAEYKYEKGIANVFVSRFNGKKEAMASYKKSLQGIKKNISFIYTFANGDLYNCYKDEYCSNVSEDLGMTDVATTDDGSSASKADEKQVTQELIRTAEACCKKEIKEPMKLTGNVTYYGDVYVSSDLDLNGYKCIVYGNLIQSSDTLTLNGGTLDVSGDYRMEKENVDSTGNVSYSYGYAKLIMTNSSDIVNVGGTFENYMQDRKYASDLQAGVMSVKGDFIVKEPSDDRYCSPFKGEGTFKTILNGNTKQMVCLQGYSGFNELEILNNDVIFTSDCYMEGFKTNQDIVVEGGKDRELKLSGVLDLNGHNLIINGDLKINGDSKIYGYDPSSAINVNGGAINVNGDLELACNVDLKGGEFLINGNLLHSDGNLNINGGTLDVSGDYRMERENVDSTGNVSYSYGYAKLIMTNSSDIVNVGGTFENYMQDRKYASDLQAGVMSVKGDFIVKEPSDDRYCSPFKGEGTFKTILNGNTKQMVCLQGYSGFNELEILNNDVIFTSDCYMEGFKTNQDIVVEGGKDRELKLSGVLDLNGHNLIINGDLKINGDSKIYGYDPSSAINVNGGAINVNGDLELACNVDLKGGEFLINGNLLHSHCNLNINGGTVKVTQNFRMERRNEDLTGNISYYLGDYALTMRQNNDYILIDGNFEMYADDSVNDFSAGTLEVHGDFILKGPHNDFNINGTNTVILNGLNIQKVQVDYSINNLYLTKDKSTGYNFVTDNCWNKLYLKTKVDKVTVSPELKDVCQGEQIQYSAQVSGINSPSQDVTWAVTGAKSADTHIDENGLLSVGEDEKAATLIVTATSVADPAKSASVNVKVEGSDNTKVVGYSVGLSDMISLNMYTYVPKKFLSDAGANAVFTLADGTVTQQPLSEFKKASYNGVNTVVINTKMVPAYITRSVTMKIVGSDGKESEGFTYSIYEYAKDYIKYATTETEYQKALPLVKAMLDYGAYSQLFFGVDASNLANYDRVSNLKLTEGNVEQTSCDSVFSAITNEETGTLGNEELIYQNISLICESETSMKLYFQNKNNLTLDQIKEKYAIKVYDSEGNVITDDGCDMQVEGEQFWIKIKNLGPVKLSSDYTIEFTSEAGTQSGTVSPICYIKKAMKQDDMNLQNLCKAMYLYNKATLEYIGQ